MADGHFRLGELGEHRSAEHLADQAHVFMIKDGPAPENGDAGPLLAPVLHGAQGVVGDAGGLVGVHPNDNTATLWMRSRDLIALIETHGSPVRVIAL